jgi:DNA-binding protein HU-beta
MAFRQAEFQQVLPAPNPRGASLPGKTSIFPGKTRDSALLTRCTGLSPRKILDNVPRANHPRGIDMAAQLTKSQLIEKIATETEMAKRDVKGVLETLATLGYKELKKNGAFVVPGFAKFVVIKKPATKARKGTNPFTGEPMTFKAKPARKIVRARPVKAAKEAVA